MIYTHGSKLERDERVYNKKSYSPESWLYLVCSSQEATKLELFFPVVVYDSVCVTKIFYSYMLKWACGWCNGLVTKGRNLKENLLL